MKKTTILAGVLAGIMLLGTTTAFAADTQKQMPKARAAAAMQKAKNFSTQSTETLNANIDKAVASGKITKEQADMLKERAKGVNNKRKLQAVSKMDITNLTERVNAQVKEGKMTQEQADKILATKSNIDQKKAEGKATVQSKIDAAVKSGKITQAQADKIKENINNPKAIRKLQMFAKADTTKLTARLNTAVKDGKITQEKADKVLAVKAKLEQKKLERKAK